MTLRTLIVDDEPVARQILREELEQFDEIEIVGEAADGAQALEYIESYTPDLVLLDLQMPKMGGFEVIRRLNPEGSHPVIVVVTAYDQHAIHAFDAGAIDYLLKPIGQERLAKAVDRALRLHARAGKVAEHLARLQEIAQPSDKLASSQRELSPAARKIVAKTGEEYLLLNSDEVFAFQAEGDLVWIVTMKKRYLATQTLTGIQERLRDTTFRRIHRNALVNIDHVRKMSPLSSQRWLVTLTNQLEFVVSKRQAGSIRRLLSW